MFTTSFLVFQHKFVPLKNEKIGLGYRASDVGKCKNVRAYTVDVKKFVKVAKVAQFCTI